MVVPLLYQTYFLWRSSTIDCLFPRRRNIDDCHFDPLGDSSSCQSLSHHIVDKQRHTEETVTSPPDQTDSNGLHLSVHHGFLRSLLLALDIERREVYQNSLVDLLFVFMYTCLESHYLLFHECQFASLRFLHAEVSNETAHTKRHRWTSQRSRSIVDRAEPPLTWNSNKSRFFFRFLVYLTLCDTYTCIRWINFRTNVELNRLYFEHPRQ